jgi:GT2 family glycosyltransferase
MPNVTIIILTYNSSRFISNLLESLRSFKSEAEIILVDNSSTDDTVEKAKIFDSKIKIVESGENLGFAKGINFGAKQAKGKYLLFINPDTVFRNGKLTDMISVFEENKKAGVVGGKLISKGGHPEKSAGRFFGLVETLLIVLGLDEIFDVRFSPDEVTAVDFVSGGFMMVRSELFKKLNGFDEKFFMYVEDMEFCFRVKKAGLETYFTPEVYLEHAGQGSSNRGFAVFNIYKGILYFYKKHKNKFEYGIVYVCLWAKSLLIYLLGKITHNSYYTKAYGKTLELF